MTTENAEAVVETGTDTTPGLDAIKEMNAADTQANNEANNSEAGEADEAGNSDAEKFVPPTFADIFAEQVKDLPGKDQAILNRYKDDPTKLLSAFVEQRRTLSKRDDSIKVPGDDATDEEKAAYRKAVGVPETPDGYQYEFTEAEQALIEADPTTQQGLNLLRTHMHEQGASPGMFNGMMDIFTSQLNAGQAMLEGLEEQFRKTSGEAIRAKYEDLTAASANVEKAKRAFGDDLNEILETQTIGGWRLGDHPVVFDILHKVGSFMGEDDAILQVGEDTPTLTEENFDEYTDDLLTKIDEAKKAGDREKEAKLRAAYKRAFDQKFPGLPNLGN